MFKIRTSSRVKEDSPPIVYTENYYGANPDLRVQELVKNLIFRHGFKVVRVSVLMIDTNRVSHTEQNLTVRVDSKRR
jgi:hypothetical protein